MPPQSIICPSCGARQSDATACTVCGYNFQSDAEPSAAPPAAAPVAPVTQTQGGFCPHCGTRIEPGHKFCTQCGTPLVKGAKTASARPDSLQPKTMLVAGGIVVLIVAGVVALTSLVKEKPAGTAPAQPEAAAQPAPMEQPQKPHAPTEEQLHAIQEFKKQIAENPKDTLAMLHLANSLYDVENFSEALPYYRQYLAANPKNVDVRVDFSYCLFRSGDLETAVTEAKAAIKLNPKHQVAYYNLAMYYFEKQNMADGSEWLEKCIAIDSTSDLGQKAKSMFSNHAQLFHNQ